MMRAILSALLVVAASHPAAAQPDPSGPPDEAPPAEEPADEPVPAAPAVADEPASAAEEPAPAAAAPDTIAADGDLTVSAPSPAVAPRFAPWSTARFVVEAELISQARMVRRDGDDLSELRLDRGEFGGRLRLGPNAAAELRFEAVRSAAEGGALGIDGDATVFKLKTAQVMGAYTLGRVQLDGALGFVPDPWIRTLEDEYTARPLSRTGSERLLGWPTSDLSAMVRVTAGMVRASIAVGNGEGTRYPERNTGKTTTGVLEVVAVNTPSLRLSVSGVARDGSIGVASIRDRRIGGGLTAVTPWVRAGGEVVFAYGIGDRGELEGVELGGWAEGRVIDRVYLAARGATLGYADGGGRVTTYGGGLAVEPWRETTGDRRARGRFRLWLAVDRVTTTGLAMPLPGADAGDATQVMLIGSAIAPFQIE